MTIKKILIIFIVAAVGFIVSCSKGSDQPGNNTPNPSANSCDGINAKFAADISPLVQTRCASGGSGCHGAGSSNGCGALTNFTQIKNASISIKSAVVSGEMPLGSSLTSAQKAAVSCWVDNGALDN